MEFKRKKYNHSYLNIAPLVDVVFLLLLFFMLSSHLVQEPAIKIRLPESKTAVSKPEYLPTVFITSTGEIYLENEKVTLKDLSKKIKTYLQSGSKEVRIKADKNTSLSLLISVIDQIKVAGVKDFNIVTTTTLSKPNPR